MHLHQSVRDRRPTPPHRPTSHFAPVMRFIRLLVSSQQGSAHHCGRPRDRQALGEVVVEGHVHHSQDGLFAGRHPETVGDRHLIRAGFVGIRPVEVQLLGRGTFHRQSVAKPLIQQRCRTTGHDAKTDLTAPASPTGKASLAHRVLLNPGRPGQVPGGHHRQGDHADLVAVTVHGDPILRSRRRLKRHPALHGSRIDIVILRHQLQRIQTGSRIDRQQGVELALRGGDRDGTIGGSHPRPPHGVTLGHLTVIGFPGLAGRSNIGSQYHRERIRDG